MYDQVILSNLVIESIKNDLNTVVHGMYVDLVWSQNYEVHRP